MTEGLTGIFKTDLAAAEALTRLRQAGRTEITVFSPIPSHALAEAEGATASPVGRFTLVGALAGAAVGFGLCAYCASVWNLTISGKPVLSWISFAVVAFEVSVLFGALGNFLSMLLLSGLPSLRRPPGYDPRFSRDRFGLYVPCSDDGLTETKEILETAGAVEIHERSESE